MFQGKCSGSAGPAHPAPLTPYEPLAVLLVGGEHDLGTAVFSQFFASYASQFGQVLFVSVGILDYGILDAGVDSRVGFRGSDEAERLIRETRRRLDPYVEAARGTGLRVDTRVSVGTSAVEEIDRISDPVAKLYPRSTFFLGRLMRLKKRWFHRLLHLGAGEAIHRRLRGKGYPVVVLPVVLLP